MTGTSGTVRVGVCAHDRRVDLVVPGGVPVADLVPELARDLGLLDPEVAHEQLRLVTLRGACLESDLGLTAQGVGDGQLLSLVREVVAAPERYDDLAEAMVEVVSRDLPGPDPATARLTTRLLGALLATLGVLALVVVHAGPALVEAATALTVAMALLTLAGAAAPATALAAAGLDTDVPVDVDRLAVDAASAHRVLVALTVVVGVVPGLVAPLAVPLGPAGSALALTCALLVLLRTRRYHSRVVVGAGLAAGTGSLLSVVASVLVVEASWRTQVAVALLVTGVVALILPTSSARARRIADVLETASLVAVPPLLVVAVGLPTHLPG